MLCTEFDGYMKNLCHNELMISWQITLTNGTVVYGDYEREGFDNPWTRLKEYCNKNNVLPVKVQLYMFGARQEIFFENDHGLDGLSVVRGVAQDQAVDGSYSKSYQTLTVSLLKDDCSEIDVRKFVWPHNEFEERVSTRKLTKQNLKRMIFKNGSEKRKHPQVQECLNGAGL
jgi:hypothetical protein|tara:strand:- start:573 stop:1088 length:516 start_codon:yes stop_codon:yes gene_type:complete